MIDARLFRASTWVWTLTAAGLAAAADRKTPCNPNVPGPDLSTGKGSVGAKIELPQPQGEEDVYPAALDGSPYAFYFAGNNGSTKWTIFLQGGGWCYDEVDCGCRAGTTLGSSTLLPPTMPLSCNNHILPDGTTDPNCTIVHLPYLDGASFSGYRSSPVTVPNASAKIWMRGIKNLDGALDWAAAHGLGSATEVVVAGVSAGGLATFLHADRIADRVRAAAGPAVRVTAQPNVGFFLDHDNFLHTTGYPGGPNSQPWATPGTSANYTEWMRYLYTMQNLTFGPEGGLTASCQPKHPEAPHLCFMAPHMASELKTPTFMVNGRFDAWQLENIFQSAWETPQEMAGAISYGQSFLDQLQVMLNSSQHGGWIHACLCHCAGPSQMDPSVTTKTEGQAYADWFYGVTPAGRQSFYIDTRLPNAGGAFNGTAYRECLPFPGGPKPPRPSPPAPPAPPAPSPPAPPHQHSACPAHSNDGCAECVGSVDGRCPGMFCGQPCVHLSQPEGAGAGAVCQPANWWKEYKSRASNVTCVGNATGCARSCA